MSAPSDPELAVTSLENRALLVDCLLSCSSPRETAYSVQCVALYCVADLFILFSAHGQWGVHR